MSYVFLRHPVSHISEPDLMPGYYAKSLRPSPLPGRGWAIIRCPRCQRAATLGANHTVMADGTVMPSFVCPFQPCSFHKFVRLDAW